MKLIKQEHADDCLCACLASLLDLPLGVVPNYAKRDGPGQLAATQKWLRRIGWTLLEVALPRNKRKRLPLAKMSVPAYCIVGARPRRLGWGHAVIGELGPKGLRILHDPSPHPCDIKPDDVDSVLFLVPAPKR